MKVILSEYGARIIDVIVDSRDWYLEFRYRLKDDCFMLGYIEKEREIGIEYLYEDKVGGRFVDILSDFDRISEWKMFKEKITRICKGDFEFKVDIPEDALTRQELGLPDKEKDDPLTRIKQLEDKVGGLEKRYKNSIVYPEFRWGTPVDPKPDWMDWDTFHRSKQARPRREPWSEYGYPYEAMSDSLNRCGDISSNQRLPSGALKKEKK